MKRGRRLVAFLAGYVLWAAVGGAVVSAEILIYEGFDYERRQGQAGAGIPGEGIDGLDGGSGLSGPWGTVGNYHSGIPEGEGDYGTGATYGISLGARVRPLGYTDLFGNVLSTAGNQVRTSFGSQSREERAIARPIGEPGSTVWISFLAQAHGRAGSDRFAFVELSDSEGSWIRLGNVNPVSSGNWGGEVHASVNGIHFMDAGGLYPMDRPTMYLARLEFPESVAGTTRLSVWLNPRNLVQENGLASPLFEFETPYAAFDRLTVAGRYSTDFDEIRLGTTFEAVTPIEPVSPAVPKLGVVGGSGEMRLSWPIEGGAGYVLQSSLDLKTWVVAPGQTGVENGGNQVMLPTNAGRQFFRLLHTPATVPSPRLPALEAAGWDPQGIRSGVVYYERHIDSLFGGPQVVNVLAVDLDDPGVRIELTANDVWGLGRRPVPRLAEHAGAIAAINGGFAPAGVYPEVGYGMMKFRGVVWPFVNDPAFHDSYEALGRNAVGIDAAGEWHFASRGTEGWEVGARWPDDWPGMVDVMAGGSQLVRNGRVHPLVVLETTRGAYLSESVVYNLTFNRHPRTALGITENRVAVLATVAGRFPGRAVGMTLHELAELMLFMGCRDALELDGGGSTTMWIGQEPFGGVVNYPTDNGEFDHEGARSLRLAVLVMERE